MQHEQGVERRFFIFKDRVRVNANLFINNEPRYQEGYTKGVHDVDVRKILKAL